MRESTNPTPSGVMDCLADEDCRAILRTTHGPRTAPEISEECDIPLSTVYRKVDRLAELSLLETRIRIDSSGRHPTQYQRGIDGLLIQLGPRDDLSVSVYRTTERDGSPTVEDGTGADADPPSHREDPTPVKVEFVGEDPSERTRQDDGSD
jgi:hypothetical protein